MIKSSIILAITFVSTAVLANQESHYQHDWQGAVDEARQKLEDQYSTAQGHMLTTSMNETTKMALNSDPRTVLRARLLADHLGFALANSYGTRGDQFLFDAINRLTTVPDDTQTLALAYKDAKDSGQVEAEFIISSFYLVDLMKLAEARMQTSEDLAPYFQRLVEAGYREI